MGRVKPETAADRLGEIQARIKELKGQEETLRALLIKSGYDEVEGRQYRASIIEDQVRKTCWRKVAEHLGASRQLIRAHTRIDPRIRVSVQEI